MQEILSNYSASIDELKNSFDEIIRVNEAVAIMKNDEPMAYLVPSELYANMLYVINNYCLAKDTKENLK